MYEFSERTIKVIIDQSKCEDCKTKACIKACSLYSRGILTVRNRIPALRTGTDATREGTECLACEEACRLNGFNMITIKAPIPRLEEYKRAHGG